MKHSDMLVFIHSENPLMRYEHAVNFVIILQSLADSHVKVRINDDHTVGPRMGICLTTNVDNAQQADIRIVIHTAESNKVRYPARAGPVHFALRDNDSDFDVRRRNCCIAILRTH